MRIGVGLRELEVGIEMGNAFFFLIEKKLIKKTSSVHNPFSILDGYSSLVVIFALLI